MNIDELSERISRLEDWVIEYLRNGGDRTFGQFWEDYSRQDPELIKFIDETDWSGLPGHIQSQLMALSDSTDNLYQGKDYPDRTLREGAPLDG